MKYFTVKASRGAIIASFVVIALCAFATLPLLSQARPDGVSVVITNDSNRGIRNVFFSPVENDNWGDNQLVRVITPGQSATVTANECPGPNIKVIGEDTDGCFITVVVACGGSAEWTVTDNSGRDCGN